MKRALHWMLAVVGIVCIAVAVSYPIRYVIEGRTADEGADRLRRMKEEALEAVEPDPERARSGEPEPPAPAVAESAAPPPAADEVAGEAPISGAEAREPLKTTEPGEAPAPDVEAREPLKTTEPGQAPAPGAEMEEPLKTEAPIDRRARTGAVQPYVSREKVYLDEARILPQYRDIYAENPDFVGWLFIDGTTVDDPVMQTEDNRFYLTRDFYGEENSNGQLILDAACDPYTPSYNLVISGHNMRTGKRFGRLSEYANKRYWQRHKVVQFDTLMASKSYVVLAAFYSADYDEYEEGFRYNADIQYAIDFSDWYLAIKENQLYETGIDAAFGDEFLTLTTCNSRRENGRFVVVARRLRDGEEIS